MFKLAIEVCFENHFGLIQANILIARVDEIRITFFGTPGITSLVKCTLIIRGQITCLQIYLHLFTMTEFRNMN